MYPPKGEEYYPSQPPMAQMHQVHTGIPVGQAPHFYQPAPPAAFETHQSRRREPWNAELCGCFNDVGNCCMTFWCPCVTFGRIAEIVDRGSTSCGASGALYTLLLCFTGCQCIYSCFYRSKLRGQYGLEDSSCGTCGDCLVHCFCEDCALCQEYRELKSRGFDMVIGWHANMERQGLGPTIPPVMQGGMTR